MLVVVALVGPSPEPTVGVSAIGEPTVSLDADAAAVTSGADPVAGFHLRSDDYLAVGADIAAAGLPIVFVFEGGYAVAEVGVNAVNVLQGFVQK